MGAGPFCLQEMLLTIENYCDQHNLKFSTDPRPEKCKTKCIAFLLKEKDLPDVNLCGNKLPWVKEGIHLGNYFENVYDGMTRDIRLKKVNFISKNFELLQEFYFAHPNTKLKTTVIYNYHFTGSPLWDLFCDEAKKLENSWNIYVRKAFDLPFTTHRYLIEAVSNHPHLKRILIIRFMSFLKQIEHSSKIIPKQLLSLIWKDTRSITGSNIRGIRSLANWAPFNEISRRSIHELEYFSIPEEEKWRVGIVKELCDFKFGQKQIESMTKENCDKILEYVSCN